MKEYHLTVVVMRDQTVLLVPERGDPLRINTQDGKLLIKLLENPAKPKPVTRDRSDRSRDGELTGRQWLVLQHVGDNKVPVKATQIAVDLSIPDNSTSSLLTALKKLGYVTNNEHGQWDITFAGMARLDAVRKENP